MALGNSCPTVCDDRIKSYEINTNTCTRGRWYLDVLTKGFAPKTQINVFVTNQFTVRDLNKFRPRVYTVFRCASFWLHREEHKC